jgi:CelD/BcsL family acetyltransferase involved in cellulose biosynthesis
MLSAQRLARPAGMRLADRQDTNWRFLSREEGLARLASADRAAEGARAQDGFSDPHCLAAAGRAAARESSEILVAVGSDGRSELLIPLRMERSMGIRQVVPLTAPLSQYAPHTAASISATSLRALLDALRREKRCDMLLLRRVREDNPLRAALHEIGIEPSQESSAPFIDLAAFPDFEAYLDSFSGKTRRNRRRELRRLEEFGPVDFEVLPGREAGAALGRALDWKRAWLREYGIESPVFDDGNWQEALLESARAGHAFVSVLCIAGSPAAVELGFVQDGTYVAYLGAFDPEYAKLSVGQEQMSRTIAWCFEQGLGRYDLLPPDDEYKRHWTRGDTSVPVADYAIPLSSAGHAASFAHRHLRPLAKQIVLSAPAGLRRLLVPRLKRPGRLSAGLWPSLVLILALLDPTLAG